MINEAIIFITLFLCGFFAARTIKPADVFFNIISAIPIGIALWFFSFLFAGIIFSLNFFYLSTNQKAIFMLVLFASISAIIVFISLKQSLLTKKETYAIIFSFIIISAISILANLTKPALISGDTSVILPVENPSGHTLNVGISLFGVAVQFMGQFIHYNILFGHSSIYISLSLSVLISLFIFRLINKKGQNKFTIWFCTIFPPLLFFSTFIGYYNIFYFSNHLITAFFYLIALFSLHNYAIDKETKYFYLIIFSLVFVAFLRMEGYLFAVFFIFCFLHNKHVSLSVGRKVAGLHFLFCFPYLAFLIINSWGTRSFINEHYLLVKLAIGIIVYASFFLKEKPSITANTIGKITPTVLFAIFTIILVFFIYLKPYHMLENFRVLTINLFYKNSGGWAAFWFAIIPMSLFVFWKNKVWLSGKFIDLFFTFFVNAVFLSFLLAFFRTPLLPHMYDSVNRMIIHFTPILLIWLFYNISDFFEEKSSTDAKAWVAK